MACPPSDCFDVDAPDGSPCEIDASPDGLDDRTSVTELDFGPYDLTPDRHMFGIRTSFEEWYGGGGATFETLSIFRIDGDVLVPVLDVPVSVQKMTAGDWNSDGSRQHDLCQAYVGLFPRARGTSMADLVLRPPKTRTGIEYRWDSTRRAYICR